MKQPSIFRDAAAASFLLMDSITITRPRRQLTATLVWPVGPASASECGANMLAVWEA